MMKAWIAGIIILCIGQSVSAQTLNIVIVGLFSDQAVVEINKKRRLLKVGETSPEGVTLVAANSRHAILEKDGVTRQYELGTRINANFSPPDTHRVLSIWPTHGMYLTPGSINGYSVDFLVDTGASAVAINAVTAKRIGLDYEQGKRIGVKTASGIEIAYHVILDKVQVGDIVLHNIRAMVLPGAQPEKVLLGMSFLSQLDIQRQDQRMDLRKKF